MLVKKYLIFCTVLLVSSLPVFADQTLKISDKDRAWVTKLSIFRPEVMPREKKFGFCWVNSNVVSRSDVWRCMVGNNIFDPCFTTEYPDKVICEADPSKNTQGFLLHLTKPLPKSLKLQPAATNAWMVELEDGDVCRPYTGTMPIIHDKKGIMTVKYGCKNGANGEANGLLDGSVVLGKVWRAKKITYVSFGNEIKIVKIQSVKIKNVWR